MPSSTSSTTIRAFVQWREQTVFAGEEVQCKITFKNIAQSPGISSRPIPPTPQLNGFAPGGERQRKTAPLQPITHSRNGSWSSPTQNPRSQVPPVRGHRPTLSLNVPVSLGSARPSTGTSTPDQNGSTTPRQHQRSLSIVSLGDDGGEHTRGRQSMIMPASGRGPIKQHVRSTSLQVLPYRSPHSTAFGASPLAISPVNWVATQPSPLSNTSTAQSIPEPMHTSASARRSRPASTLLSSSRSPRPSNHQRFPSSGVPKTFQFPASSAPNNRTLPPRSTSSSNTTSNVHEHPKMDSEHLAPLAMVLSGSSMNGTPRSSGEFRYSLSNNSSDTLASEYIGHASRAGLSGPTHLRTTSSLAASHHHVPEILMMGYAQIMGSFTLDGSLVNQTSFEEVKRKGVFGGQGGGGVVGVDSKYDGGLFGGFGWGNISESIGGLLGGGELSSIKEMRSAASSKSVPLLSTPQSILFVDLRLAPGESRTYNYSFTLPQGIPPSHRGKAIKISYNLVIGTQRAANTAKDGQTVRQVEIPFRVFGSIDERGQSSTYDLLNPYIILKDQARTFTINTAPSPALSTTSWPSRPASPQSVIRTNPPSSSLDSFLSYVDSLLSHPSTASSGLLSPTAQSPASSRRPSFAPITSNLSSKQHSPAISRRPSHIPPLPSPLPSTQPMYLPSLPSQPLPYSRPEQTSTKSLIDHLILTSNQTSSSAPSPTRFAISRASQPVCNLLLPRPAYRLNDTIHLIVDFATAIVPTYAITLSLENSETIGSSLALRSENSVQRVTRRVHVRGHENTLFARRVVWQPVIPTGATPTFHTKNGSLKGVSCVWGLRVSFTTKRVPSIIATAPQATHPDASHLPLTTTSENGQEESEAPLLEVVESNKRETIRLATREIEVETFEVLVPITVYGAALGDGGDATLETGKESRKKSEKLSEGLVV